MRTRRVKGKARMTVRVLLASLANYVATYALVALVVPRLPMQRMDAVLLSSCFAFPVMIAFALWAFAETHVWRVALVASVPMALLVVEGLT